MRARPVDPTFFRAVGRRVQRARLALGWTQEQLGDRVMTGAPAVSRIESGAPASLGMLIALAGALGLDPGLLLGEDEADPEELALLEAFRRLPAGVRRSMIESARSVVAAIEGSEAAEASERRGRRPTGSTRER